jgi:hypothetical protein
MKNCVTLSSSRLKDLRLQRLEESRNLIDVGFNRKRVKKSVKPLTRSTLQELLLRNTS